MIDREQFNAITMRVRQWISLNSASKFRSIGGNELVRQLVETDMVALLTDVAQRHQQENLQAQPRTGSIPVVQNLHIETDDATVWAREFCSKFGTDMIDEGLMIGWFANAIEVAKIIERRKEVPQ